MLSRKTLLALLLCLAAPGLSHAQDTKTKRTITVDDYFTQADIFELATGDFFGERVAYTEGRWQKSTDDRKADLWLTDRDKSRRLTFDRASYRSPQWGPGLEGVKGGTIAGTVLYALANRKREGEKKPPFDGKAQVWRIAVFGLTEPHPVTQVEGGIEAYEVRRDTHSLLYLVHQDHQVDDFKDLREKFANVEYGQGKHKTSQIWKLDLSTWRAEKMIDAGRFIHEFTLSPDGKRLAMITAPDEKVVSFEGQSRIDVWEAGRIITLADDLWRKKAPSPYAWLEKLAWSRDSQCLAFNAVFDGFPAEIVITEWANLARPVSSVMLMPPGIHVRGYGSPLQWRWRDNRKDEDLCFLAEEKGRVRLMSVENLQRDAKLKFNVLTPGDVVVEGFNLAEGGTIAIHKATPDTLGDIYVAPDGQADFQRKTNVNPQAESWKLPQLKVVTWKGAKGDPVEGILELPHDYKPGTKIPLVVEIHGGPTTATYFKQQFWIYGRTLLPAQGYAVLCPNYRGSTGYGDKFCTDLIGRENDIEVEDILKGVDAMIEQGIADPDRLAVSGWSNGGYLTNCLIAKTTRFKAAISGAGIVDAIMEFGSNDEPAYAIVFKQGFPWSNPDKYHKASSTYNLDKIKTPTLIHVGANDDRCPPGHSRLLFRALKEYNNVPAQLMVYPGESHGLMKYRNRQAKMEWDLAWLKRYLK
jgi:dipeptidyl aminopeptidase/acylaminoacyl peptidase